MSLTPATPHQSSWFSLTPDQRRFPLFRGDQTTEVVVIGGGIVGALTAYRLAESGRRVILLERNHIGSGDTGYSTAFLLHVPDVQFDVLRKSLGAEKFKMLLDETIKAQQELRALVKEKNIDCDWRDVPALFGSDRSDDPMLKRNWEAIRDHDQPARFVTGTQAAPFVEAISFDDSAAWNPRAFLVGLLKNLKPNLQVFEETAVTRITPGSPVKIITAHGSLTADQVVVATGSPAELLPDLSLPLATVVSYVLTATYKTSAPIRPAVFWDTATPYHYFRRLDEKTIMLGGADRVLTDHQTEPSHPHQALVTFLDKHFPGYTSIEATWSGKLLETPDGLPLIGAHPRHPASIFIATGLSGNGMVMGAVASRILEALATKQSHPLAAIVSPVRHLASPAKSEVKISTTVTTGRKPPVKLMRLIVWLVAVVILIMPAVVFWQGHHSVNLLGAVDLASFSAALFPLVGLYALTFVWIQIIVGSQTLWWHKIFPSIISFHRWLGIFTLTFALIHPLLLLIGVGPAVFSARTFVAPHLVPFIWVGYAQLLLIVVTASTALLRRWSWLKTRWRTIHYLNYAVFYLAFSHSLALGHDVRTTSLRYLWYGYALTVTAALVVRVWRAKHQKSRRATKSTGPGIISLGKISDFPNHQAKCLTAGGKSIAIFRSDDQLWALNNICSHAGGPLYEGTFDGSTVTCPWHGSRFEVASGRVISGPATQPQQVYPVRVNDGKVELTGINNA